MKLHPEIQKLIDHGSVTVDEDTKCFVWQGWTNRGNPVMPLVDKNVAARPYIFKSMGLEVSPRIKMQCENKLCLNPEHMKKPMPKEILKVVEPLWACTRMKGVGKITKVLEHARNSLGWIERRYPDNLDYTKRLIDRVQRHLNTLKLKANVQRWHE